VVHVAAAVGGRIIEIGVRENSPVRRGDVLFQIDPLPYELLVSQAQADLALAEAQLDTQKKYVSTQRSNAAIAQDQTTSAKANYELATRTAERLRPLTAKGYVPNQALDQADVTAHDAATRCSRRKCKQLAAVEAIDSVRAGESLVAARQAALALAKRNLDDTTVRAPHDGLVVGLVVSSGEFVIPGQSLFTLINTEEWFASANLARRIWPRYTRRLRHGLFDDRSPLSHPRDCREHWLGRARSGPNQSAPFGPLRGTLTQLGRVAQRFPVRIRLEEPPPQVMRLGASAVGRGRAWPSVPLSGTRFCARTGPGCSRRTPSA
jgi:multidrug efflux system membrane fusion protein